MRMTRLASESLDHDLTRVERAAVRLHLLYCSGCRRYMRQITLLRDAMRWLLRQHEAADEVGVGVGRVRRDGPLDYRARKVWLGRESNLLRYMRRRPARRIVGPGLG